MKIVIKIRRWSGLGQIQGSDWKKALSVHVTNLLKSHIFFTFKHTGGFSQLLLHFLPRNSGVFIPYTLTKRFFKFHSNLVSEPTQYFLVCVVEPRRSSARVLTGHLWLVFNLNLIATNFLKFLWSVILDEHKNKFKTCLCLQSSINEISIDPWWTPMQT